MPLYRVIVLYMYTHTHIYVYDLFTQIQGKIRKSLACMMIECAG